MDEPFWYGDKNDVPTVRSIVDHMKIIVDVSLKYPVILSAENLVMDGMHRISKALFLGLQKISVVKFKNTPIPDYTNVYPDELPYE